MRKAVLSCQLAAHQRC